MRPQPVEPSQVVAGERAVGVCPFDGDRDHVVGDRPHDRAGAPAEAGRAQKVPVDRFALDFLDREDVEIRDETRLVPEEGAAAAFVASHPSLRDETSHHLSAGVVAQPLSGLIGENEHRSAGRTGTARDLVERFGPEIGKERGLVDVAYDDVSFFMGITVHAGSILVRARDLRCSGSVFLLADFVFRSELPSEKNRDRYIPVSVEFQKVELRFDRCRRFLVDARRARRNTRSHRARGAIIGNLP